MSKEHVELIINSERLSIEKGTILENISDKYQEKNTSLIVGAKVNNKFRELTYKLEEDSTIEFVDFSTTDGMRIYQRSLVFVFVRATMEVLEGCDVNVKHSLNKGLYCEFACGQEITQHVIAQISDKMQEIIDGNERFVKEKVSKLEAAEVFKKHGMHPKEKLLKYRDYDYINLYELGWLRSYFYGYMVPSTGYLKWFELRPYDKGVILRHPTTYCSNALPEYEDQPKLAQIYNEAEAWGDIMDVAFVANLNERIETEAHGELIRIAEALHEKKVAHISDMITESKKRVVLIAGPSSSGKTTFANRLMIQLKVNGLRPITLSTDDYFVDRTKTPLDEFGQYDFESIDAVDVALFNEHLSRILKGEAVEIPTFNFQKGMQEYNGNVIEIRSDQPIIIEGIHGLNEKLTQQISKNEKFKIYISDLTQLNIDDHNRIPTTDTRLIRRIVRDSKYRGHSAKKTIGMWASVRRGEERNIFPYQEGADVMFNSALVYELSVLKKFAEPLLEAIQEDELEFIEAKRLLKFLSYFLTIEDTELIVQTSILKEFIGGSCFHDQ